MKWAYRLDGKEGCRKCVGLKYRSQNASKLQQRARNPKAVKAALRDGEKWLDGLEAGKSDKRKYSDFIGIIMATNEHETQIDRETASDFEKLQGRVIVDDVVKSSALMARIEATIESGTEHKMTRAGECLEVPLSVDSFSKLAHAWAVLANLRASRSGLAIATIETRDSGKADDMRERLKAAMRENNYVMANGQVYADFEAENAARRQQQKPLALPAPEVEKMAEN